MNKIEKRFVMNSNETIEVIIKEHGKEIIGLIEKGMIQPDRLQQYLKNHNIYALSNNIEKMVFKLGYKCIPDPHCSTCGKKIIVRR